MSEWKCDCGKTMPLRTLRCSKCGMWRDERPEAVKRTVDAIHDELTGPNSSYWKPVENQLRKWFR